VRVEIEQLLPGFNCGECGWRSCREFARHLLRGGDIEGCPPLKQERFSKNLSRLKVELARARGAVGAEEMIRGVIDGLEADLALAPLAGEPSCREDIHPFDPCVALHEGDLLRYRPLGCPITHFARVLASGQGIATVHMTGPLHLMGNPDAIFKDVGLCIVLAFEGLVSRGRVPDVGETVRFLPEHCMMQKVHSGVVVHSEGRMVRIEGVDLKVW